MIRSVSKVVLALILTLIAPSETFAQWQNSNEITERVQQSLRSGETLKVLDWLRLSPSEEEDLIMLKFQLRSLTQRSTEVSLFDRGNVVDQKILRSTYPEEITFSLSPSIQLRTLRLFTQGEVLVESITAVLRPSYSDSRSIRQVFPEELVRIPIQRLVRGSTRFRLAELASSLQAISLLGAEVERVVVMAQGHRGFSTAQVIIDGRAESTPETLSQYNEQTPIRLGRFELINQSIDIQIQGEVFIDSVLVKVGQVRRSRQYETQSNQEIRIEQLLGPGRVIELGRYFPRTGSHLEALTVRVQSFDHRGELELTTSRGEIISVSSVGIGEQTVEFYIPQGLSLQELQLRSWSNIRVESIRIENSRYSHRRH